MYLYHPPLLPLPFLPEVPHSAGERTKEKASLDILQQAFLELNSRKIKDPLSSFLPGIPGGCGLSPLLWQLCCMYM